MKRGTEKIGKVGTVAIDFEEPVEVLQIHATYKRRRREGFARCPNTQSLAIAVRQHFPNVGRQSAEE